MIGHSRGRVAAAMLVCVVGLHAMAPRAREPDAGRGGDLRHRNSDLGRPLAGANVLITELRVSVVANAAGRYTISLPSDQTRGRTVIVRARSIGFKPDQRSVAIDDRRAHRRLHPDTDVNRLEEVVITGVTGATAQRDLPFTVAHVGPADLQVPAADALTQLAGKIPGAQMTSFNGRPGVQPAVLLRGPKSFDASGRGQNPLFIVDGIVVNGSLPDLNAQDIESIEIVKGAAAATLYGSRAGNGVVQITTKRASSAAEGTRFQVRTEYGQGDIPGDFPLARHNFLMMDESGTRFCVRVIGNVDCARTVDINEEALRINEQATGPQSLAPQVFVQDFAIASTPSKALARGLFQINSVAAAIRRDGRRENRRRLHEPERRHDRAVRRHQLLRERVELRGERAVRVDRGLPSPIGAAERRQPRQRAMARGAHHAVQQVAERRGESGRRFRIPKPAARARRHRPHAARQVRPAPRALESAQLRSFVLQPDLPVRGRAPDERG